jgi:ATP synthase protein I
MQIAFRLGTELTVATIIGGLMGYALDSFFETKPWGLVVGVVFGVVAGCLGVYRVAMRMSRDDEDKDNNLE